MILEYYNEKFECERAIKGKDFIILYDTENKVIAEFKGINDFSQFVMIEGGFTEPPITETELLKAQIQALSDENEFLSDCLIEMAQVVYA